MGAKRKPRVEDLASDQEDPETQLSEVEEEEELAAPETDTDRVPVEELTNEDILRGGVARVPCHRGAHRSSPPEETDSGRGGNSGPPSR